MNIGFINTKNRESIESVQLLRKLFGSGRTPPAQCKRHIRIYVIGFCFRPTTEENKVTYHGRRSPEPTPSPPPTIPIHPLICLYHTCESYERFYRPNLRLIANYGYNIYFKLSMNKFCTIKFVYLEFEYLYKARKITFLDATILKVKY